MIQNIVLWLFYNMKSSGILNQLMNLCCSQCSSVMRVCQPLMVIIYEPNVCKDECVLLLVSWLKLTVGWSTDWLAEALGLKLSKTTEGWTNGRCWVSLLPWLLLLQVHSSAAVLSWLTGWRCWRGAAEFVCFPWFCLYFSSVLVQFDWNMSVSFIYTYFSGIFPLDVVCVCVMAKNRRL